MSILKKRKLVPILLGCLLVFSGCGNGKDNVAVDAMETIAPGTSIEVMTAEKLSIENRYTYSGTVQPVNEVNVLSTVNGTVSTVNYDEGDKVSAGDVLFTMDTTDIQNNIKIAKASLESAEAGIRTAETNLEYVNGAGQQAQTIGAKTNLENAKIALDSAKLAHDNAKSDYETYKVLYEADAISKDAIDKYKMALDNAELNLKTAETAVASAEESYEVVAVKTPKENLKKAQNALATAKASKQSILAQIESYNKVLNDAVITAPISGTVSKCGVKADTVLAQGSAPFVIVDLSSVNIEVKVAEQVITSITIGDEVDVLVSSVSPEYIRGNITSISPVANVDGTYTVKVQINNADGKLKAGMFGEVYFTKEKSQDTIVVPREVVLNKGDEYYVFTEQNGVVTKTNIEVGVDNGEQIEVRSGLTEGVNIVSKGQTYLTDGEAVKVVNDEVKATKDGQEEA